MNSRQEIIELIKHVARLAGDTNEPSVEIQNEELSFSFVHGQFMVSALFVDSDESALFADKSDTITEVTLDQLDTCLYEHFASMYQQPSLYE